MTSRPASDQFEPFDYCAHFVCVKQSSHKYVMILSQKWKLRLVISKFEKLLSSLRSNKINIQNKIRFVDHVNQFYGTNTANNSFELSVVSLLLRKVFLLVLFFNHKRHRKGAIKCLKDVVMCFSTNCHMRAIDVRACGSYSSKRGIISWTSIYKQVTYYSSPQVPLLSP